MLQVFSVEAGTVEARHARHVAPLTFGNLSAKSIPLQLDQNDVLGGSNPSRKGFAAAERFRYRSVKYAAIEVAPPRNENVDL